MSAAATGCCCQDGSVPQRLILIGGSAGTGKTTVARGLASRLGAGWLQVDTVWLAMQAGAAKSSRVAKLLDVPAVMGDPALPRRVRA
jgi:adenylate kinase family enzyme